MSDAEQMNKLVSMAIGRPEQELRREIADLKITITALVLSQGGRIDVQDEYYAEAMKFTLQVTRDLPTKSWHFQTMPAEPIRTGPGSE